MCEELKVISDDFIEVVRRCIVIYLIKHPFLVLWYGIIFLQDSVVYNPYRIKCFVPRYILKNLSKILHYQTCGFLGTIARGKKYVGEESCVIGKGEFSNELKECYLEGFPYASWVPNFFELLYEEFVKASSFQTKRWWNLKKEGNILYLCFPAYKSDLNKKTGFVQGRPLSKEDRRKLKKVKSV